MSNVVSPQYMFVEFAIEQTQIVHGVHLISNVHLFLNTKLRVCFQRTDMVHVSLFHFASGGLMNFLPQNRFLWTS